MIKPFSADVLRVGELFQLGCFQPASVQPNYQWDEERASRLLKEITTAMLAAGAGTVEDDLSDGDGEANEGDDPTELPQSEVVGRKKIEQEGPDSSFERFLIAFAGESGWRPTALS